MEERVKKCFDEMSDEMNYLEQHKSALVNELESLNDGRSVRYVNLIWALISKKLKKYSS